MRSIYKSHREGSLNNLQMNTSNSFVAIAVININPDGSGRRSAVELSHENARQLAQDILSVCPEPAYRLGIGGSETRKSIFRTRDSHFIAMAHTPEDARTILSALNNQETAT